MIDRRRLIFTAGAFAALPTLGGCFARMDRFAPASAVADPAATAAADALVEEIGEATVQQVPELATILGLDAGALKSRLSDRSAAARATGVAQNSDRLARLRAIDRNRLSGQTRVGYDSVRYHIETLEVGRGFSYGDHRFFDVSSYSLQPYTISQLTGVYADFPNFLETKHTIETTSDAEAYLARLTAAAGSMREEASRVAADAEAGVIPPDFILAKALLQMRAFRAPAPADSGLVRSLTRRAGEKGLAGDWAGRATRIVEREVYPAMDAQMALMTALQPRATSDAGVWKLPRGGDYYATCLKLMTTTDLDADAIHAMGLDQSRDILSRMDAILKSQGMTQGTVGQRMAALGREPRFVYPNTDEGRAQLLGDLNGQIAAMNARLPRFFGRLPRASVEVRRIPPAIEAGAPGGSYQIGSLDGSRPGAYYINLRDTAGWPRWSLPTLTYHEATPGHHLQLTLAVENTALPLLAQFFFVAAYAEGWALYAEQLADEMGVYAEDPFGELGYLQSLLFRASRLVVDTGLHHKRWSRDQAIRYMVETGGDDIGRMTIEIERYCVWPGQACSYKVGHSEWVRLREDARTRLGDRFDIKGFHDAGLQYGGMPLKVLEGVIADWISGQA